MLKVTICFKGAPSPSLYSCLMLFQCSNLTIFKKVELIVFTDAFQYFCFRAMWGYFLHFAPSYSDKTLTHWNYTYNIRTLVSTIIVL